MQRARIRGSGARLRRISALALVVVAVLGLDCGDDGPLDGGDSKGEIFGVVRVDGSPRSDVTVRLIQGATEVDMTATDGNGAYKFTALDPGMYTVAISAVPGADCPGSQPATVIGGDRVTVNFSCTIPAPEPGAVSGLVTLNGVPAGGFTVQLIRDPDGTTAAQGIVDEATGSFSFANIASGAYVVEVLSDPPVTCPPESIIVPAGETATVVIACVS